jgi:hypothetical protein
MVLTFAVYLLHGLSTLRTIDHLSNPSEECMRTSIDIISKLDVFQRRKPINQTISKTKGKHTCAYYITTEHGWTQSYRNGKNGRTRTASGLGARYRKMSETKVSIEEIPIEKMGNYAARRFLDHSYFLAALLRCSPICRVSLSKVS